MLAVGINELKAKLSGYVRAAKAGETVLVDDRGEVVRARLPFKGWKWQPESLGLPRETVDALRDDLRADRCEPGAARRFSISSRRRCCVRCSARKAA